MHLLGFEKECERLQADCKGSWGGGDGWAEDEEEAGRWAAFTAGQQQQALFNMK